MSTKDEIFNNYNTVVKKINSLNYDDYLKKAQERVAVNKEAEVNAANSAYNATKENTQNEYNKAINDTKAAYEGDYERNAVQRLINEKTVAEKNANLGLTDSGLNRTQQTAVQLSYANQKGDIDLARQSALNNLTLELTSAITKLETDRNSSILSINEKWNNYADNIAQTNYNNDRNALIDQYNSIVSEYGKIAQKEIEANTEIAKAQVGAATKATKAADGSTVNNDYVLRKEENGNTVQLKIATTEQNEGALKAYNSGGTAELKKYLERMPEDVDKTGMSDYAYRYGEPWVATYDEYDIGWNLTTDTKNGKFLWFSPDDNNDVYTKETETGFKKLTFKELKKRINSSNIPKEKQEILLDKLRKQSKK